MAGVTLPPFSGDTPTCPKCGYDGPSSTTFLSYGRCVHVGAGEDLVEGYDPNERLHRSCGRCSYSWDEATWGS